MGMCKAVFDAYMKYDEDETLARVIVGEDEVPLNISLLDGSDRDLAQGEACGAFLWSTDYEMTAYPTEEEYYEKDDSHMASVSMIPMGTFPAEPEQEDFQQNAFILFSGIVREAERNPQPEEGAPLWRLQVETYALTFDLFSFEEEQILPGAVVHGHAWLYGKLKRTKD